MSGAYQCSVVLAAHGSLAHENSNQSLFELANRVAESGIFSVVTPAFLNGEPQLSNVLDQLPAGDVVVIPVMTSEGYYSQTILPGKLAENLNFDRFRILRTPALGVHPEIAPMVANRVATIMTICQLTPVETTVIVVGHGTTRHPNSGASTDALAVGMRQQLPELDVHVAFLDQAPTIAEIVIRLETLHTIVVPFLISRGPHATHDIPAALGLPTGPEIEFPLVQKSAGRITICDLPIGMYVEMAELCLDLAADQMLNVAPPLPTKIV